MTTHYYYSSTISQGDGRCGTSPTRKSRSLPSQTYSRGPIPAPGRLAPGPPAGRLWATAVVHPDHLSYLSCCARHTAVYGRRATHHVSPAPTIVSGHAAPIPASGGEPTHGWRDTHRQALTSGALRERHARRDPTCEHQAHASTERRRPRTGSEKGVRDGARSEAGRFELLHTAQHRVLSHGELRRARHRERPLRRKRLRQHCGNAWQ